MSDLSGALCVGRHWLFESTDLRDHIAAAEVCAGCPVIAACRELLESARRGAISAHGGGPTGTWAGHLYGKSGGKIGDFGCGTDSGYYRHRHLQESACERCLRAHAHAKRMRANGGAA